MWREVRVLWRDMGWYGRWVQVMEYRSVEREGVRKRVCSHTHIDMLHLLCTSLYHPSTVHMKGQILIRLISGPMTPVTHLNGRTFKQ